MATRSGFEPPISALTGQYVNRYTTGPWGASEYETQYNCSQQVA